MLDSFKMKKLSISLLLLALLTNSHGTESLSKYRRSGGTPHQQNQTGNVPPLVRIYHDLAHLARITNAISLQAHAVEGTVKMREIGSELLGTRMEQFTILLDADVAALKKTIQEMFKSENTVATTSIQQLSQKQMALQYLSDSVSKEPIYKEAKKANMTDIVAIASTINGNSTWKACSREKNILPSLSVLEGTANALSQKEKNNVLSDFKAIGNLNDCLSEANPLLDLIQKEFFPKIVTLNQVHQLTEFMDKFKTKLPMLNTMPDFLRVLEDEFSKTASFRQLLTSKQAAHLEKVISAHFDGMDHAAHVVPTYTSGLPNGYADLMKIKDDINSQWFLKNVAYGNKTNVKIVEKGLELFAKFTGEMKILHDAWTAFISHDIKPIFDFVEVWNKTEHYKVDSKVEESLGHSANSFKECLLKAPTANLNFDFADFLKIYNELTDISDIVGKLIDNLKKMQGEVNEKKLNQFFEDLKTVKIAKDYEVDSAAIRSLQNYKDFQEYATFVKTTKELQDELAKQVAAVDTTATVTDVAKALGDSKLLDVLDCFKNNKYDGAKMSVAIGFLDVARDLTSNVTLEKVMIDYLDDLEKVQVERLAVEKMVTAAKKSNRTTRNAPAMSLLNLPNHAITSQVLGAGLKLLGEIDEILKDAGMIKDVMKFDASVNSDIVNLASTTNAQRATEDSAVALAFKNPQKTFGELIDGLEKLEAFAKTCNGSLPSIAAVFEKASKIRGFTGKPEALKEIGEALSNKFKKEGDALSDLADLNLNFAKNTLHSTSTTLDAVKGFFDQIFGKVVRGGTRYITVTEEPPLSNWAVVAMCCAVFALAILAGFIGYGFTDTGRAKYIDTWLYYFPNMKVFERRWRYSKFMDTMNGLNALVESCREVNQINAWTWIKKGSYINAYSRFGNTSLHLAARSGNWKIVEMLLANGADPTIIGLDGLAPLETLPPDYRNTDKDIAPGLEKIEKLFEKYKNKKCRLRVPQVFPTHMFHVFIHKSTEDILTDKFQTAFKAISTDEPLETTTHCIIKTNEEGILETDELEPLLWIFWGVIMCKESWMTASLENEKNIRKDYEHLIKSVKWNGVLYENCILPWSEAQAKGRMPYLSGAAFVFVMQNITNVPMFSVIINYLGGMCLSEFMTRDRVNTGAHPICHGHLGALFIIHDGSQAAALEPFKKDPIYTVFTEQEFVGFLLKREIQFDTNKPSIPLWG